MDDDILLTKEAAKLLKVSRGYVRGLIRDGKLRAYKEGRRGGFRILRGEVEKYIQMRLGNPANGNQERRGVE